MGCLENFGSSLFYPVAKRQQVYSRDSAAWFFMVCPDFAFLHREIVLCTSLQAGPAQVVRGLLSFIVFRPLLECKLRQAGILVCAVHRCTLST